MNCLGIPVSYNPELESISITLDRSRPWWTRWLWWLWWPWFPWKFAKFPGIVETHGILRWKEIVVGAGLRAFPEREQEAILLHEVGHAKLNHIEKRITKFWQIIFAPTAFAHMCRAQEFQADYFSASCGYAVELASALARLKTDARASLHPAVADRIARLAVWHSKA